MIYIILTYLFSPLIYILLFFRKNKTERILIIQTAKIGDLICSTPVLRAVKRQYPDSHLSVMMDPLTKKLVKHNPYVNEIISISNSFYKGLIGKIRLARLFNKGQYDIAICLNPNISFTLAMFWGLIPVRVSIMPDPRLKPAGTSFGGITYKIASRFCTHLERHIRGRLVAETYLEMLKAIGIDSKDIAKDVFKSPDADGKVARFLNEKVSSTKPQAPNLIGLAVTSGNRLKEWGAKNIAALADKLTAEKNNSVVLVGSQKDKDVSEEILKLTVYKEAILDAVGKFSLQELPALIEKLSLFIGVDTGVIYMADALNIPVVNIAGPSDMEDQRPTGTRATIIQKKDIECVPCSHTFSAPYECRYGHRDCIVSVSIDEVFDSAKRLLLKR